MLAAGCSVGLKELALEAIHCRVFAQSTIAGAYEWRWVDVLVASSERGSLQDVTPV